ncbi:hypothetical protein JTB14_026687 [Gonioctena quinquepunctata]|nr:hypothetical protein JTB14_026687 [Gonioctena quinquepunctata]
MPVFASESIVDQVRSQIEKQRTIPVCRSCGGVGSRNEAEFLTSGPASVAFDGPKRGTSEGTRASGQPQVSKMFGTGEIHWDSSISRINSQVPVTPVTGCFTGDL